MPKPLDHRARNREYEQRRGSARERGYTWQWEKARKVYLAQNPLCRMCEQEGRVTPAALIDHIIPHKGDQALFWDSENNWQPLCRVHHDIKTVTEDGGLNSGAHTHPDWLPAPACPVVLVTGSPGAGKTTYCREHAKTADEIIDLDECFTMVCGVHGHKADRKYLKPAIRLRNKLLANLAQKRAGRAFLIVSSPTKAETEWWIEKLKAEHVRLDPGMDVCLSRVSPERQFAVREWYAKAKANDWRNPNQRWAIGEDGWPV